jgi:serine/threonine-protein kinase
MNTDRAALVDEICRSGLLSPAQVTEVRGPLSAAYADAPALAKSLVQRGWLTVFQMNQLLQGGGPALVLGPYCLLDMLGEGAISQVFKARHRDDGRLVALKILRPNLPADDDAARQFGREMAAVQRLSHPHIVQMLDAGHLQRRRYLAAEFLEGTDLRKVLELHGPLPVAQACTYVRQAALGLQHASQRHVVHRDIKPANLFLVSPATANKPLPRGRRAPLPASDAAHLKILDWGLARLLSADEEPGPVPQLSLSDGLRAGMVLGTVDYVAPEQAMNPRAADTRSDLYSLGCTFYHLLTGRQPFPGGPLWKKLLKHQQEEPTPVDQLRPDLPPGLAAVLHKLMAKDPDQRYQTPAAVVLTLAPFCRGPSGAPGAV